MIASGSTVVLIRGINDTLETYLKSSLVGIAAMDPDQFDNYVLFSEDSLCQLIATAHEEQVKEFPDALSNNWSIDIYMDAVFTNEKVATLSYSESTYLGGAHPNYFTHFLNFDKSTGKTLRFSDLIKDEKKFIQLAEAAFRAYQELNDNQDLEEAGYFFDQGIFYLPQNFAITSEGLYFYYNPYEAGAYALGPLEYTIPFSELSELIDLNKIR
ncbi:MAG: DUF3298 domain-containing protein [Saprospiraceae bacterium]|nr:DUF3298 domain-containing protein [Saprospiraceae bacterium]